MIGSPGSAVNAARQELQELLARSVHAVNARDVDAWLDCWSPMATWQLHGRTHHGCAELRTALEGGLARYPFVVQTLQSARFSLGGGISRGICMVQEIVRDAEGAGLLRIGVYHDHYEKRRRWVFRHRRFDPLLSRPLDLADAELQPWPTGLDGFMGD